MKFYAYIGFCLTLFLLLIFIGSPQSLDSLDVSSPGIVHPVEHEQAHAPQTGQKWALLIGIDNYKNENIPELKGAVNDVSLLQSLLKTKYQIPGGQITTLINEEATRHAIFEAIEDTLLAKVQKDDIVIIHFSGHGSQRHDESGDEGDRLDETLVPYDARTEGVLDIADDELQVLLQRLGQKTQHVTFILDSCFSGSALRASHRVRFIPPADSVQTESLRFFSEDEAGLDNTMEDADNLPQTPYVLLSSTRHNQVAHEYRTPDGNIFGAFTYFFHTYLNRSRTNVTYREVIQYVTHQVNTFAGTQTPELEGTHLDQFVFDDSSVVTEPHVVIYPTEDADQYLVNNGALHGVTVGSLYDVYLPGTNSFGPSAQQVATLEISRVKAFQAYGSLKTGGGIVPASRAVERAHAYEDRQVIVDFVNPQQSIALSLLKQRLDSLTHITLTENNPGYTLRIGDKGGQLVLQQADSKVAYLSQPFATVTDSLLIQTSRAIEQWARWYNLAALENNASYVGLDLRLGTIGQIRLDSSRTVFTEGESLEVIVTNTSDSPLYIAIIELLDSGSVRQVYPPFNYGELLQNGEQETIQFAHVSAWEEEDLEAIIKVFATTKPVDLYPLTQEPVTTRSSGRLDTSDPLEQLLMQASAGVYRTMKVVQLDTWAVAQQRFLVKKK